MTACSSSQGVEGSTELCSLVTAAAPDGMAWAALREGQVGILKGCAPAGSWHGPELLQLKDCVWMVFSRARNWT